MRSRLVGLLLVVACGMTEATRPEGPAPPVETPQARPVRPAAPAESEPAVGERADDPSAAVGPAVGVMPTPLVTIAGGADAAVFGRGDARRRAGDMDGMRQAFVELLRDHPTSPFVPHAFFAFGEVSFGQGRMEEAKRFFEKAATFPKSDVAPFARHRIAWCELDLGRDEAALNAFVQAATAARALNTEQGKMLFSASIFDSTIVFARVGKLDKATVFYERVVSDTDVAIDRVLARLADAAVDGGREDELARACKAAGSPGWCTDALQRR